MTQAERVLDYLWSVAPNGATNGELARRLGIRSHHTVYMLTQELMHQDRIRGSHSGTTWVFYVAEDSGTMLATGPAKCSTSFHLTIVVSVMRSTSVWSAASVCQ